MNRHKRALALAFGAWLSLTMAALIWNSGAIQAMPVGGSPIVSQFTVPGSSPRGLTWDGSALWLVDNLENVYKLDTSGNVLSSFSITFTASGMTWDGSALWINSDSSSGPIYKLNTGGVIIGSLNVGYWPDSGVTWDGANFWVGDYNFSQIHKHSPSGAHLLYWDIPIASGIEHPTGMVFDGTALWIGDSNEGFENNVERISTVGQLLNSFDTNDWGIAPVSWPEFKVMAWDGQYLWYSADDLFTVYQIDVGYLLGTPTATFTPSLSPTPSHTPTPTRTPTQTHTPGQTSTATATVTLGPSPTPTNTPAARLMLPAVMRNFINCFTGPWEVEPNGTTAQANGPLCSGQDYFGYHDDADDYYTFSLFASGAFTVSLASSASDTQLLLYYQSDDNLVAQDANLPYEIVCPPGPQGNCPGAAGTYYVRVFTGGGVPPTTQYILRATYP
jgi:hypothetical protein